MSGYLLLRVLGMQGATWVGVALNLGVAAVAGLLARTEPEGGVAVGVTDEASPEEPARPHGALAVRMVLIGIGLSGFCALAYELLWTRMLNLFLNNNVYSFTAVLATFLAGIALGSLVYAALSSRVRHPVRLFALLQAGIGLLAYATPFVFTLLQDALFSRQSEALTLAKTAAIMIAPTLLMGMAVPLAVQICQRGPRQEGATVGTVYAVNTVGSILGAFAAGFVLVPWLGLHRGLIAVVTLNLLAALLALLATTAPRARVAWAGAFAATLAVLSLAAPRELFRDMYERAQPTAEIIHYEEGRIANVVVYEFFKSGYKDLFLNAIEEASSRLWHVQLFKMLGILPPMLHPDPDEGLMVAFGAGMSAGAAVDQVTSLEVVDLNPDVAGVAGVFTHENRDVIHNPGFRLIVNDGRNALLLSPRKYSVIISDATNPKTFDSWTLYTREFYELAKSRLQPGGVFCQWLVIPLPSDAVKILLNTVRDVFPHTSLWCIYGSSQCMVLATPERLAIDYEELSRRLEPEWEGSGLAEYGIGDTDKFLSFLLLGEDELGAALAGFSTVNTDDLPHAQFRVEGDIEGVRAFLDLLEHQSSVEPYLSRGAPAAARVRLEAYRSLSRRLHLGFLLNNPGELEQARAVAAAAGLAPDGNVRSALKYDWKKREYFEARVASHPDDANAHNNLGYISWREGRHDEAIRELTQALERNPDFAGALVTLARVYADAGRYDEAEQAWSRARELNPTRAVLSTARRELNRLHVLRKLRYEPDSAALHLALAEAHTREGAMVEAAEATRRAAQLSPDDPQIALSLAGLYENLEFVGPALETYRTLATLLPGDERIVQKVREFEVLARDPSARQRWLNSNEIVLSDGPPVAPADGHPETCRQAAEAWADAPFEGRVAAASLARAASLFERSTEAKPDDMHAYVDAARVYEAMGEYGRAAELWRRGLAVRAGDRGAEAHARRLDLLQELEDAGGTASAASLAEIGVLHREGGDVERAIEFLRRAVEADPARTATWLDLGAALAAAGRYPESVEALEQGLTREPPPEEAQVMAEQVERLRDLIDGARRDG